MIRTVWSSTASTAVIDDTAVLEVRAAGRPPFQAEDDVLAGERRAVVEADALAQVELPGGRVDQPPRDRERGLDLGAGVEVDQGS